MNIALYGPGRAGGALAVAASRAGHTITSIDGRNREAVAELSGIVDVTDSEVEADLLVIAVSDDAIASIAEVLDLDSLPPWVIHMSGAVPVDALRAFADAGSAVGSFHPLQTLPSPVAGANRLPGSHIAITAQGDLAEGLSHLATSIGCRPFVIADENKALYHAGAAAAANFTMASLGIAQGLFEAAGVDPSVARPLVEAIVANAFDMGARKALTGPIARGDVATVTAQLAAVRSDAPEYADAFVSMAKATADFAGRTVDFSEVLP